MLARFLRWSHQVPGRAEVPVAAFTPAPGGARHEAGITGRLPRVHSQRPADRVNASSLAESGRPAASSSSLWWLAWPSSPGWSHPRRQGPVDVPDEARRDRPAISPAAEGTEIPMSVQTVNSDLTPNRPADSAPNRRPAQRPRARRSDVEAPAEPLSSAASSAPTASASPQAASAPSPASSPWPMSSMPPSAPSTGSAL